MNRKRPVTPYGWAIKQRLAEMRLDQKRFCELHGIPPYRLSNLIHGTRKAQRYRDQIERLLDLRPETMEIRPIPGDSYSGASRNETERRDHNM